MKSLCLFFAALPLALWGQQRIYVNPDATGLQNGATWTDAYTNLHDALLFAQSGDEVWVAQGLYPPSETGNRSLRFEPLSGVRLYGGFTGTESELSQRPADGRSILEGDIGIPGDSTDNAYTLVYLYHPDSTTLIDGFVFRNAVANQTGGVNGQPGLSGAALYIDGADGEAYPLIRNCDFERNTAQRDGGAVYIYGSDGGSVSPGFERCMFRNNRSANGQGGAVYKNGASWWDRDKDFADCQFYGNRAARGACIYLREAERTDSLTLWNCLFEQNKATSLGNVLYAPYIRSTHWNTYRFIGCAFLKEDYSSIEVNYSISPGDMKVMFDSCTFSNFNFQPTNSEIRNIFSHNGNLVVEVKRCFFIHHRNLIFEWSGWPLSNLNNHYFLFEGNHILGEENRICDVRLIVRDVNNQLIADNVVCNASFFYNTSVKDTGDIVLKNNILTNSYITSRIEVEDKTTNFFVNNCVFSKDTTDFGPNLSLFQEESRKVYISNTIFDDVVTKYSASGQPTIFRSSFMFEEIDSVFLKNCLFSDSIATHWVLHHDSSRYDSTTRFLTDPLFVDPDNYDFRLQPCSPGVNAGSNEAVNALGLLTDLNGQPRIQEGTVDIGAYEHTFVPGPDSIALSAECHNNHQGAIHWTLGGGCLPIQFAWTDVQGNTGTRTDSLQAGEYRFTFTDATGRTSEQFITIPAGAPTVSVTGDTLLCDAGETGMLVALPGPASQPPYAFLWNTGAMQADINGLQLGTYTVTLTDALGCTDSVAVTLVEVPFPETLSSVLDATHLDSADGRIEFAILQGIGPYTYQWSTGDTTASIDGLAPGLYNMLLLDGAGCGYGFVFEVGVSVNTHSPDEGKPVVRVRPNPAKDVLMLDYAHPTEITGIALHNAAGQVVFENKGWIGTIPVGHLPRGLYVLYFRQRNGEVDAVRVVLE